MNEELFEELLESVKEGAAILRGEKQPSRRFVVSKLDVKRIRDSYQLSQSEFAALLGISIKTLQNWEQGRRLPRGTARILLEIAEKHPQVVWDVVNPEIQLVDN
jgi:putative transcriptional regulator